MMSLKPISPTLLCQQLLQIENTRGIKEHNRTKLPQLKNNINFEKDFENNFKNKFMSCETVRERF